MLDLIYAPAFVRQFKKLPVDLQEEALEKIELFKNTSNHQSLKVHKLHGVFNDTYSFSVNYRFRIIFSYGTKDEIYILSIGDHEVYK